MSAGSRSTVRAFTGRFLIALVLATSVTTAAVASVNHEINTRVKKIKRIQLITAEVPAQGANFLIIGSDTRQFVSTPDEEDAFGAQVRRRGQQLRHADGRPRRTRRATHARGVVPTRPDGQRARDRPEPDQRRVLGRRPAARHRHVEGQLRHRHPPLHRGRLQELPGHRRRDRRGQRVHPRYPCATSRPGSTSPTVPGASRSTAARRSNTCGRATWRSSTRAARSSIRRRACAGGCSTCAPTSTASRASRTSSASSRASRSARA